MPRLSVVLPVKDGERYLARALSSTLTALPRDAEIVVIDDGSRDATPRIIAAALTRDSRVRVITRDESGGVATALNLAVEHSDSEFVGRMDADDIAFPWRFRRQLHALRQVDFVFGSSVLLRPNGRPRGASSPLPISPRAARYHLLIGNFLSHPTMTCRREAITSLGGYRQVLVEDFELWLRACAAGRRLRQLSAPMIGYRMHDAQITSTWQPSPDDALLDADYARLLPAHLRDVTAPLRHSAVTRRRTSDAERAAWARLADWLRVEAERLSPLDRASLLRRIAQHAPAG